MPMKSNERTQIISKKPERAPTGNVSAHKSMKDMKTLFYSIGFAALLAACASPERKVIRFESDPPGARVFYDFNAAGNQSEGQSYIGQTPCEGRFEIEGDGSFKLPRVPIYSDFKRPAITFTAKAPPGVTGSPSQQKTFYGPALFYPPDKAPEAVFFDFRRE